MKHNIVKIRGKEKTVIKISLDDDCRNGHETFSMTADIYEKRGNNRWVEVGGGCCHEHILGLCPKLAHFVALHLSDQNGVPMHAVSNALYWFAGFNGGLGQEYHGGSGRDGKSPEVCRRIFTDHIRATSKQVDAIVAAMPRNEIEIAVALEDIGFPVQWKAEAQSAIAQLEKWTGQTFVSNATRSNWSSPTPEQRAIIAQRRAEGYYTPEAVAKRDAEKREAKKAKLIAELKADCEKQCQKARDQLAIDLALAEHFGAKVNAIYYQHTNTLTFNWSDLWALVTQEAFNDFVFKLDRNKLPLGIKFEYKASPPRR